MSKIKVDIEDLLDKLNSMLDDEFSVVELVIDSDGFYDESILKLKAIDISEDEDADYGEVQGISDEFIG